MYAHSDNRTSDKNSVIEIWSKEKPYLKFLFSKIKVFTQFLLLET